MVFVCTPRAPTAGVLYEVMRGNLNAFLAAVAGPTCDPDPARVPAIEGAQHPHVRDDGAA